MAFILMNHFGISSKSCPRRHRHRHRLLVDAGIVMTENVIRHAEHAEKEKGRGSTARKSWM